MKLSIEDYNKKCIKILLNKLYQKCYHIKCLRGDAIVSKHAKGVVIQQTGVLQRLGLKMNGNKYNLSWAKKQGLTKTNF